MNRLGILVGGGPAPGINCAISSSTIEACNSGLEVVGLYDGFEHLMRGDTEHTVPLGIRDVSRIHTQGGSVLRTSRANPTSGARLVERTVESLHRLGITRLVTIGGEDTATSAAAVARASGGSIRVAHIPKTIDNDLPLPAGMPTFGYETARHVGTEQVLNLAEEARTGNRWLLVVVMGRNAGHLALGIGIAAGATITIIPEEFGDRTISLDDLACILEGSIFKRRLMGRDYGLAVVAEGVVQRLDQAELRQYFSDSVVLDPHGHLRLEEIPLGTVLRRHVQARVVARKRSVRITDVTLGYTLRCAAPVPFDIDYTRTLGYGAVRFLVTEPETPALQEGGLVAQVENRIQVLPFRDLVDPVSGRMRIRTVDVNSAHYEVARRYMIRLEPEDLTDPRRLSGLADLAGVGPSMFSQLYGAFARGPWPGRPASIPSQVR